MPEALEAGAIERDLAMPACGRAAEVPVYDFAQHLRRPERERVTPGRCLEAEGLFTVYRAPAGERSPGLRPIALLVDDFDAACRRLHAAQVEFAGEPSESKGNRVVFFRDPEGNLLHLLQRAQPLP